MSISRVTWPSRSRSNSAARRLVIISIGIDTVHIPRFTTIIERRPTIVDRLFTAQESCHPADGRRRGASSLAARFAAKEAVAKALGAPGGLHWHDCLILTDESGRPRVEVTGTVAAAAASQGIDRWHVSLTHDGDYAVAQVVTEGV
jgi:holo-[acyl-carrier protein] synthase